MKKEQSDIPYTISAHAQERYAERCKERDTRVDVTAYVAEHEDRIQEEVNKMICHGRLFYKGKTARAKDNIPREVYVSGLWIILTNAETRNVITLYKVELGCGQDLDKLYVERMMEKMDEARARYEAIAGEVKAQNEDYRNIIQEGNEQIQDFRARIRKLEEMCEGYNTIIRNNGVRLRQAEDTMADIVNTLIGKKSF
ncbi:hypothetical protein [Enterocloster lavalensis]|uniref:hypothetical protein n=1 Tax=Enterocloster lavalensis TaxID=460384 RepID=UPI001D06BF84|nr:hypothetical protein [Enterocloster lavalensis]MCB6345397.1 hypothetical protein [Enterocloster lavalensis]